NGPAEPAGGDCFVVFGVDIASMVLGGLAAGMVLFIVSVGLSVTMGLMGFANLAHGAFAMLGGYIIVLSMRTFGIGFVPALFVGFLPPTPNRHGDGPPALQPPLQGRRTRSGAVHDRPRVHLHCLADAAGRT